MVGVSNVYSYHSGGPQHHVCRRNLVVDLLQLGGLMGFHQVVSLTPKWTATSWDLKCRIDVAIYVYDHESCLPLM